MWLCVDDAVKAECIVMWQLLGIAVYGIVKSSTEMVKARCLADSKVTVPKLLWI